MTSGARAARESRLVMRPGLRKLVLTLHLASSVGWLGAVVAYIALDANVAVSDDPVAVRAAWIGMWAITQTVIVPLALGSVLTGVAIALGTKWGLVRHWWVAISLALTLVAFAVLLLETRVIAHSANVASGIGASDAEVLSLPTTLPHSVGGLLVLLLVQVLNVYKPVGLTPYGWRRQRAARGIEQAR